MDFENLTPFSAVPFIASRTRSEFHLTLLVKGSFQLRPGQPCELIEEPLFPTSDLPLPQPEGATEPLQYASDLVPFKPRADVLVVGSAYRPAGHTAGPFSIAIRVGDMTKQLVVSGDRQFDGGLLGRGISEEETREEVPVSYANAFGGPGFAANPFGKGFSNDQLPNIEYPDQRMRSPGDRVPPAGFGPIAADWEPRRSLVGSYGGDYLEQHWPAYPADFDWGFFNAAPADQQVEGFLRGDETFVAQSLHAEHELYQTQLPGVRIVCVRDNEDGSSGFVELNLDTLHVDMQTEQIVLLWRAMIPVASPHVDEIKQLGILAQPLSEPVSPVEDYQRSLAHLIEERDQSFEPEGSEERPLSGPAPSAATGDDDERAALEAREREAFDAELKAFQTEAGIRSPEEPPPKAPPPLDEIDLPPDIKRQVMEAFAEAEAQEQQLEDEQVARQWTREKVLAAVASKASFAGVDLSGLDLSQIDLADANLAGAILRYVDFREANLSRATMTGSNCEHACFDGAMLQEAQLDECVLASASLVEADLSRADLSGSDLMKSFLDRANLTEVRAAGAVFVESSLGEARLASANLAACNLDQARLPSANLEQAILADATLTSADLSRANLDRADLTGTKFDQANLTEARLDRVSAADADFTEANAARADFRGANCEGAWFSEANLDHADFRGANLNQVQFDGTTATAVNFTGATIEGFRGGEGANLTDALFRGTVGVEPVFETCTIDGADFSDSEISGGNFIQASAVGTNFSAANIKSGRFDFAVCRQARFDDANLFESCFSGANLTEASVCRANLYGSEFLDAEITDLQLDDANLNMTKLVR